METKNITSTSQSKSNKWVTGMDFRDHPNMWFVWEDLVTKGPGVIINKLVVITEKDWLVDATFETSSDNRVVLFTNDDTNETISIEMFSEVLGYVINDTNGNPIAEASIRIVDDMHLCFDSLLCYSKIYKTNNICNQPAETGSHRCSKHSKVGRRPGLLTMDPGRHVTTGEKTDPACAFQYWVEHKPKIAVLVQELAESLRIAAGIEEDDPIRIEFHFMATQMISRNMMMNKAIAADFKSAIKDPETGIIVGFKAHYLLDKTTTFDARIMQKLKDFGIIKPIQNENEDNNKNYLAKLWETNQPKKPDKSNIEDAEFTESTTKNEQKTNGDT